MKRLQRECPSWLDDDACREWRRLMDSRVVRDKDPETVAAYCFTVSLWTRVRSTLECFPVQGPPTWLTHDGRERSHPILELEARLAADLLELSDALDVEPLGREAPKPSRVLYLDEGAGTDG